MPRADKASRVIAAPAERIYSALVDRDELAVWLPPRGMSASFERFDPRPGGGYRLVLTYTDPGTARGKASANSDVVEARFVELVPGVRVVLEVDFESDNPLFAGTMTVKWELTPVSGETLVEISAAGVPDGISAEDHAVGMASSLANLADHLEP